MKYIFVALLSGLVGLTIGYVVWGTEMVATDTSFRSEPIPTESAATTETTSTNEDVDGSIEGEVQIEASAMSAEQQALLRSFGIDPAGVTVTAEMIACAEATVGKERLDEITGGASPTFFESARLLGCYKP